MTCSTDVCGTGGWNGPKPGDPDNNSSLSAVAAFGGIDVSWTLPTTNPYAVAYTRLFRGVTNSFNSSLHIADVGGTFYYDKSTVTSSVLYYYWIQFVSVNGTFNEIIGPASATAKPTIEDMITLLSNKISSGQLATSLKSDIDNITLNATNIQNEIANRIAGNAALSAAMADLQTGVTQALSLISTETTQRQEGASALVTQLNTVAALNATNAAAILTEHNARVTADTAMASDITSLYSAVGSNAAAITSVRTTKIGYSATSSGGIPYDGNGSTVVYPSGTYPSGTYPEYAYNRYRIIDAVGVANWNATSAGASKPLVWVAGLPLASVAQTVQVTGPDGSTASMQEAFSAQATLNGNFKAQYTAKVNVNGLVGGFGIYNDGITIEAGFDVDTFWVGTSAGNKVKPFMISGGVTYINDAVIQKLTFTKLRDESGSVMIEGGKIKADYLQVQRIMGGAYTGYSWPSAGSSGFYLGPEGLLLGNWNNGKYFQVETNGNIYAPGFNIVNGAAKFSGELIAASGSFSGTLTAATIVTENIVGGAVSTTSVSTTSGNHASVSVYVPAGTSSIVVMIGPGSGIIVGSGESMNYIPVTCHLMVNGGYVLTDYTSSIVWAATNPTAGWHTIEGFRSNYSAVMSLVVTVNKR